MTSQAADPLQALLQRLRSPFTSQSYAIAPKDVRGVPGLSVLLTRSNDVTYSYTPLHYGASQMNQKFYDQYDLYRFVSSGELTC